MFSLSNKLILAITASALCCCLFTTGPVQADPDPTIAPAVPGAVNAAGGPYLLKYKFVVGKTTKYSSNVDTVSQMAMAGASQPMAMHMAMTMEQTVQSVDPATGNGTENVTIGNMSGTMNGQPFPMSAQQVNKSMTVTLSPTGQPIIDPNNPQSSQIPGLSASGAAGMMSFLPKTPVNIGDSWTTSMPMGVMPVTIVLKMTLKAVSVVNGDSIATIESVISSAPGTASAAAQPAMANMKTSFRGDMLTAFDMTTGVPNSVSGTMIMDMSSGTVPQMHMSMNMKMALLPPSTT